MNGKVASHLSFSISRHDIVSKVLIPKYYDPELAAADAVASRSFLLPKLGDLLLPGNDGSRLGSWIRREHYGSGKIPFVRTSDFNEWRLRPDYKKGVARYVYEQVAKKQDVQIGDILMVAHGTYLVGTVAIVTEQDYPLVLQDHVFRLRVRDNGIADPYLLLAALSTHFVRRQIRARQFSADIIDKIGERHLEVCVPIPKEEAKRRAISDEVKEIIESQTAVRSSISRLLTSDLRITRERATTRHGFSQERGTLKGRILIPKYYDPVLQDDLLAEAVRTGVEWVSIGELVERGWLQVGTGVEVGKMAYGTGTIPFIRTTDIAELDVKANPRQGVARQVYEENLKASVAKDDILVIRDGTYLVGSSAIVSNSTCPALICGGIYRLRCPSSSPIEPFTLLALLNLPLVRRQLRAKQFTRDVIDTIGKRLFEVLVLDPTSEYASGIGMALAVQMREKAALRSRIVEAIHDLEPGIPRQSHNRPGWSMRA